MVEFCRRCGGSLARGDLTFWMGEMFTSSDYLCPFCGKTANPEGPKHERAIPQLPTADQDIVFVRGKTETRPPPPENG